ncbi:MAG: hypothetical protein JWO30_3010 [Fibrobacteres bacterium]|nr:hypothetical protein [Fibrobacterota bacterium]
MFGKKYLIMSLATFATATLSWGNYLGSGILGDISFIDFSMSTGAGGHSNWFTWTPPGGSAGTKYIDLQLAGESSGGNKSCFEVSIVTASHSAADTDLRAWYGSNSIDDDGPAGSRLPYFRFWGSTTLNLTISAYSTSYNAVDFYVQVIRTLQSSKANCATGNNYPTIDDAGSISNANNTSN